MSTCKRCRSWDQSYGVCWKLATIAREAIEAHGVHAVESIRALTYPDSSCTLIDELSPAEVAALKDRDTLEVTDMDVLRARAAAYETSAYHWREQCKRAEARNRQLEQALVEAGRRADALGLPLTTTTKDMRGHAR